MKKKLFILLLYPVFSFAQEDWEYVGSSTDESSFYIKNIQKQDYGNRVEFWNKVILPNKVVKTKKGSITKKGDQYLTKYEADCRNKSMKKIMIVLYDGKGETKDTDTGPFFYEPVIPDSMGESLLLSACSILMN